MNSEFVEAFDLSEIPEIVVPDGSVTAIVLAYNEMLRFPHFLEHHRKAGVEKFLVVDNGSTDGSAEYLDAQADVVRFPSSRPYKDFKSKWRHLLANQYLTGQWAFFPDVDELIVYPGWPEVSLKTIVKHWRATGVEAVFSTMVDMYPRQVLADVSYQPGAPFLSLCPYFDSRGYRLLPLSKHTEAHFPTPPFQLYGGARERLFPVSGQRKANGFDLWLEHTVFAPNAFRFPAIVRKAARKYLKAVWPEDSASMGKVPLVLWSPGFKFGGGVHRLNKRVKVAEDWVALLHFKYLDDFAERSRQAVDRAQHANAAGHYRHYVGKMDEILSKSPCCKYSVRFTGVDDLEQHGLVRASHELIGVLEELGLKGG